MKVGDLIRVRYFGSSYNGKVGILMSIRKQVGFKDTYSVRIPSLVYEIGLTREQCEVLT